MVLFYYACTLAMKVALLLLSRWQVFGRENAPSSGPLIVVANHLNTIDPPLLSASVPRRISFMAKEELFHSFPLGLFVRAYGAFSVRRGRADREALRKAQKILRRGRALGMFPEGGRSSTTQLQRAHSGTSLIALSSRVPLLPVAITGTQHVKGLSVLFHRPHITVTIGQPFYLPHSQGKLTGARLRELSDLVMRRIAELLPQSYRGVYGDEGRPTTLRGPIKPVPAEEVVDED